jgi:hypothetical protein
MRLLEMKDVLGNVVDNVWKDVLQRIHSVDNTDIDLAIDKAYSRGGIPMISFPNMQTRLKILKTRRN